MVIKPSYISCLRKTQTIRTGLCQDDEQLWHQIKAGERVGMRAYMGNKYKEFYRLGMSIKGDRVLVKDLHSGGFLYKYGNTGIRLNPLTMGLNCIFLNV